MLLKDDDVKMDGIAGENKKKRKRGERANEIRYRGVLASRGGIYR